MFYSEPYRGAVNLQRLILKDANDPEVKANARAQLARAYADLEEMKRKIAMPAVSMRDTKDDHLFARFSRVAQRTGVYTIQDYASIIESLVQEWKVEHLSGLSDLAAKAQDYLCTLSDRYRVLAEKVSFTGPDQFSWIFDRPVG